MDLAHVRGRVDLTNWEWGDDLDLSKREVKTLSKVLDDVIKADSDRIWACLSSKAKKPLTFHVYLPLAEFDKEPCFKGTFQGLVDYEIEGLVFPEGSEYAGRVSKQDAEERLIPIRDELLKLARRVTKIIEQAVPEPE